jgi:4a-hydroxytetrahydrobiopterin dehydratase
MPSRDPLSDDDIADALDALPGWTHEDDKLKKTFEFSDFREAISFIVRLSFYAEEMTHHPELENVYNTVSVALTTHDADGQVTEIDVELASQIEDFVWV